MLEMFERLLAALIILALLVLVMFIALPYPTGGDRTDTPPVNRQIVVEPDVTPSEAAKTKASETAPNEVAKNDAIPKAVETPAETPAAVAKDNPVPNPPGNNSVDTSKAPTPANKAEREIGSSENTQPRQKVVKSNHDRLQADAELPAKPVETAKADKPAIEKSPKPPKSKSDKLRTDKPRTIKPRPQTASRIPVQQPGPRLYIKEYREREDGVGHYIRHTAAGTRTHYDECANGQCECSCDRPYWARSSTPCWD